MYYLAVAVCIVCWLVALALGACLVLILGFMVYLWISTYITDVLYYRSCPVLYEGKTEEEKASVLQIYQRYLDWAIKCLIECPSMYNEESKKSALHFLQTLAFSRAKNGKFKLLRADASYAILGVIGYAENPYNMQAREALGKFYKEECPISTENKDSIISDAKKACEIINEFDEKLVASGLVVA
jgi:hypothetical protein